MSLNPARKGARSPAEPVFHELPPIRFGGADVAVRIAVRRTEQGWRARLIFGEGETELLPATAEIFYAPHEADLWESVRDLREHHVADLYRSIAE
jgi:hypothetical protein